MTSTPTRATTAGVGLRSGRGPVLIALMLSVALVALDSTIIATAVPSIVRQLGGFNQFPWLFSIYLLTQAVTVPLYGKFADLRGRRPVLFFGIGVFLLGSVLCGVAWSMPTLIAFRGLQGIGAGAVLPMTTTIVGDQYSVAERAKVQGYIASVWGISSVVGPTLGGLFAQYLTWRWIFFVNLPIGALAVWMLARHFSEQVTRTRHAIDAAGAVTLTAGCSLVILGLLEGGVSWSWTSWPSATVFGVGFVLLVVFVLVERRAAEPVLPLWVFRPRVLVGGNLTAAGVGALLIVLSSYVPTYVQEVLGTGALVAGLALAALTIGWPIAAACAGRVYMRLGFRDTALIGSAVVLAGTALCALLHPTSFVWEVAAACFVVGVGLGLTNVPSLVAVQSVVGWRHRGVVTGTNMFSRSMGSAVGVAVFGAIANAAYAASSGTAPPAAGGGGHLSPTAVFDATHEVFLGLIVVALLLAAAVLVIPRQVHELDIDALVARTSARAG